MNKSRGNRALKGDLTDKLLTRHQGAVQSYPIPAPAMDKWDTVSRLFKNLLLLVSLFYCKRKAETMNNTGENQNQPGTAEQLEDLKVLLASIALALNQISKELYKARRFGIADHKTRKNKKKAKKPEGDTQE